MRRLLLRKTGRLNLTCERMKWTAKLRTTYGNKRRGTPVCLAQARAREEARFDYHVEMDLIGGELRRLRMENGLSIETVARAMGMRKYRLCQIEHGLYIHLGVPQLYRLCKYYGVSARQVLAIIPGARFENLES